MKLKTPKRENPKAKAAELQREWEAMLARHSKPLERGARALGVKSKIKRKKIVQESTSKIGTKPDAMMGLATRPEPKVYTGTKIIGIATMHKSNMVPIFNEEAAVDVAQMRRN